MGQGTPVVARAAPTPYERWERGQRRARRRQGHRLGLRLRPPRRHHLRPVPGLASIQRSSAPRCGSPTARTSCSAACTEEQLPTLYDRLDAIGMAEPGAELARDVVACPGADTCNLAVTQSRGLADAIGAALEEAGLAEVGGVRTNISGCTNSLRPAPHRRHRLLRRRAPGPRPVRPRLPDAARRLRRPGADPLRREGAAPAGQGRARGRRPGRPPLRRRARGRRDLPRLDGPRPAAPRPSAERAQGPRRRSRRPRRTRTSTSTTARPGPYVAEIGESECAA